MVAETVEFWKQQIYCMVQKWVDLLRTLSFSSVFHEEKLKFENQDTAFMWHNILDTEGILQ